jgi:hypothetical protein
MEQRLIRRVVFRGAPNGSDSADCLEPLKAACLLPAQDSFGSSWRNVVVGLSFARLDASLQKQANLHEKLDLQ